MPRAPKLTKKKIGRHTYWATQAGCVPGRYKYFGNVKEVGHKDADEFFVAYRKSFFTAPAPTEAPDSDILCWERCDRYLLWAQENLAAKNCGCKKSCLNQWCDHPIANSELPSYGGAIGTAGKNKGRRISDVMLSHNMVHVKACWNWAADHRRGNLLPKDLRSFAGLAKIRIATKPKSEFELPTEEEFQALLEHADADFGKVRGANGRYRRRTPKKYRTGSANPYRGFADIVRFCYAAGPRTSEITSLRV